MSHNRSVIFQISIITFFSKWIKRSVTSRHLIRFIGSTIGKRIENVAVRLIASSRARPLSWTLIKKFRDRHKFCYNYKRATRNAVNFCTKWYFIQPWDPSRPAYPPFIVCHAANDSQFNSVSRQNCQKTWTEN